MGTNYENMGAAANRQYKDTLFRMLFKERESLLSLYNAVNGTEYGNPDELEIVTLENAVYVSMKNDQAFILDCRLNLYEHQSTINPNMPLRFLNYVAAEYRKLVKDFSLYSTKLIKLPNPNFIVFYNGTDEAPERDFMNLSDSFEWPAENPNLELIVTQLNINPGFNEGIKAACQILKEYMLYVEQVRRFAMDIPLDLAIEKAVDYCIVHGILEDFLRKNRAEAIEVSIFEYNAEREMRLLREEIRADAMAEGHAEGHAKGHAEGHAKGHAEGHAKGHAEGHAKGHAEGHAKGHAEGHAWGIAESMATIVCRRLRTGDTPEAIAEFMQESPQYIEKICTIAMKYAPDYDIEKIVEEMIR